MHKSPQKSTTGDDNPSKDGATKGNRSDSQPIDRRFVWHIFLGIGSFAAVSVLVWYSANWLQDRVDQAVAAKLTDEKVLRQIAEQVRPALIFNSNEAIIENMGAVPFIADNGNGIHITKESDGWPRHIHIDFVKQFSNPPILNSMYEVTVITPKRGKGFSWDFDVSDVLEHGQGISTNLWTYRLELVP